ISQLISKMPVGIGMVESAGVNKGNPYFIEFRPLLHSPLKLTEKEIQSIVRKEKPVLKQEVNGEKDKREGKETHVKHVPDHSAFIESLKKHRAKKKK
ncbi:MAG: hypothetical protein AABY00_03830, partial [Nanoarchaeota archaeon]